MDSNATNPDLPQMPPIPLGHQPVWNKATGKWEIVPEAGTLNPEPETETEDTPPEEDAKTSPYRSVKVLSIVAMASAVLCCGMSLIGLILTGVAQFFFNKLPSSEKDKTLWWLVSSWAFNLLGLFIWVVIWIFSASFTGGQAPYQTPDHPCLPGDTSCSSEPNLPVETYGPNGPVTKYRP